MCEVLKVLGQSAASSKPCKGPFDDPASGQDLKALCRVGALHYLGCQTRHCLLLAFGKNRPLIAAISEQLLQKRVAPKQRLEYQNTAIAVLNVGRMNQCVQQQSYRINKDMALLAFDLLPRIIPALVDTAPPFSALLTLWLSMIAAVGLASRPIASRHFI